jgi:NAD(P)-dependent dehydrogenase (short-subunit alcohol dehydrogenase family)
MIMRSYEWKTAVVTGAGSGIGRALAVELGRRGAKLAISDIDHGGLVDTERTLRNAGVAATSARFTRSTTTPE